MLDTQGCSGLDETALTVLEETIHVFKLNRYHTPTEPPWSIVSTTVLPIVVTFYQRMLSVVFSRN